MTDLNTPFVILTCDEAAVALAERELRVAAPGSRTLGLLAPGVLLAELRTPWSQLAAAWVAAPPIFVRHLCPVQAILPLPGAAEDPQAVATWLGSPDAAPLASNLAAGQHFSVQARVLCELPYKPFDLNTALAAVLVAHTGAVIDVPTPDQVVSVVCAALPAEVSALLGRTLAAAPLGDSPAWALVGLSPVTLNLSDWAGGMRRFAREEGQISRAEFKLLEALELFQIVLPPRGLALDLGAAPGGWTRVLRQLGQYVTAVDPGALDPRLADDPHVRHKRMTAEEYLRNDPDAFDLIVNDMRMDARDSARLMNAYARLLRSHGCAIMTLKLPEQNQDRVLEHALKILRQGYAVAGVRQLFHNRSEVTVWLQPR